MGTSLVKSFGVGLGSGRSMLSTEVRLGVSRLWRGLACADTGFCPAFAAIALASLSCSLSFVRVAEAVLEAPMRRIKARQELEANNTSLLQIRDIPGLCFTGDAGVAGLDSFCWVVPSSSASMLSRRASTPATACERNEPHREEAAMALEESNLYGKWSYDAAIH